MRLYTLLATVALTAAATLNAQSLTMHACPDNNGDHYSSGEQACEVRSTTFPLAGVHLNVNSLNGGIELIGEDRQDIALEARVSIHASSAAEAAGLLHEITIDTGSMVEAHGPKSWGRHTWSVSYKLRVPHHLAADLHALNGSLGLTAINGSIHGETTNGSVHFDNLAGDVHLTTTNGSIHANLDGSTWQGSGLAASTTNGSVNVSVPSHYSAHLVASTTNGGAHINLPVVEQSRNGRRRSIDTNLGNGGPTVSFETTNGGISIQ